MTPPLPPVPRKARPPLDVAAILVAPAGVAVIAGAQVVAGIPAGALLQVEAALIVLGGTLGALLLTYSPADLFRTVRAVTATFRASGHDLDALGATIVSLAGRAHRRGLLSIDNDVDALGDPFLRDGLGLAVDETDAGTVKEVLAADSAARLEADEAPACVLEAAAGYAPTLGILGAVLGLIHVMRTMGGPSGLGKGIAIAFVATVYGVGVANLVLLPLAGRVRERAAREARRRALMTAGICGIQARVHPRVLAHTLRAFGVRPLLVAAPAPSGASAAAGDLSRPRPATPAQGEERRFA